MAKGKERRRLVLGAWRVGLAVVLRTQGLGVAANWAQLLSLVLAVGALLAWGGRASAATSAEGLPQHTEQARELLATLAMRQWREEILVRQLDNPTPISVRWQLTELPPPDMSAWGARPNLLRLMLSQGRLGSWGGWTASRRSLSGSAGWTVVGSLSSANLVWARRRWLCC